MGRKTLPPSTSLPVKGEVAGVNTASLGVYLLHSTKTRARWAEGATCSTWRWMGFVSLYFARDSPCDDNKQPFAMLDITNKSVSHDSDQATSVIVT